MTRFLTVGAAQMGPIQRSHTRRDVVERLIAHLREAKRMGCELVVFPELTLTTFFPRWWMTDQAEIDSFFEQEMPSNETAPLFTEAKRLAMGFCLGYAELANENGRIRRFNTSILVERDGEIVGKYRKVHLPGHAEHEPERPFQHLEKRYFEVGNLGFPVFKAFGGNMGMCICNDRRWPETYRVMGLQNVEMVLLGYNTPLHNAPSPDHDEHSWFHNQLSMQAGAYQNGTWVVGVAKGGNEEGVPSLADSMIVAPSGKVVARAGGEADELVVHRCDLDAGQSYKRTTFNFAVHRQPDQYRMIVERKGAMDPSMAEALPSKPQTRSPRLEATVGCPTCRTCELDCQDGARQMAWFILLIAGLCEIGWATGLKYSEGFTRLVPSVLTIAAMVVSIVLLGIALKTLPVGTGYAVWTGIGAVGTAAMGILLLGESMEPMRLASIGLIVAGIVGLKLTSPV